MSRTSSPGHPNKAFGSYFDPEFTAEITSKMRVPDKICVVEGIENTETVPPPRDELKTVMQVPERILVAGNNEHISVREYIPELKFDSPFPVHMPDDVLAPPPNVLTVTEYPVVDFPKKLLKSGSKKSSLDQSGKTDFNESFSSPEEDVQKLQKQINILSRRVATLEQESQQQQQREIILYALLTTYIAIKGLLWLHRHF